MIYVSTTLGISLALLPVAAGVALAMLYRIVVPTNMVHIVQSRAKTTPFGTGQAAGNVYWSWPSWVPRIGVTVIELPVSNFDLSLEGYEAYDRDRVPFMVDVAAFFRVKDTAVAAQRVSSMVELRGQLEQIVQGAVRKVLASDVIDTIMLERAQFGAQFSGEVKSQLEEWGVESVKSMELMDIRDGRESKVISNIMAKKTSHIEMLSRTEVAANHKAAETAEIEARQIVEIRKQEAEQAVGERTAQKNQAVGIADQQSRQEVLTQEKITTERNMEVLRVQNVRLAEIERDQAVVGAEQTKQTTIIVADGDLEAKRRVATGIKLEGEARADAEKAMQLAPVEAQIVLAKEIGQNTSYQQYLVTVEAIKAHLAVGTEQAQALQKADVRVIANTGAPTEGARDVMGLFSSKGGTELAGMIEAVAQTPMGRAVLARAGVKEAPASNGFDHTEQ